MFAYFAMGYLFWMRSNVLTGQRTQILEGKQTFLVPFIKGIHQGHEGFNGGSYLFHFTGLWVWTTPGAYFGVPISNFFGWLLVVFIFFQLFASYLSRYDNI